MLITKRLAINHDVAFLSRRDRPVIATKWESKWDLLIVL